MVTGWVFSELHIYSAAYGNYATTVQPKRSQGIDMIDSNTRTLGVILACFVALVVLGQSAQRLTNVSAAVIHAPVLEKATVAPAAVEAPVKKASNQLVAIPKEKCGSTWVNGGNFVLVTPKTCGDVAIASMTVAVSDKPCETSTQADFQSLSYDTYFKGDFGFYLGQGKKVQCLAVKEIVGKYL
jgi:hypothetical protein